MPPEPEPVQAQGRFWSKAGFASFIAAYVWYTNDELDVIYSQAA